MSKEDKKFFAALLFCQTGVLSLLIVFSPFYWLREAGNWEKVKERFQYRESLRQKVNEADSNFKVQRLKTGFEKKGIGVEEVVNLKSKSQKPKEGE